MTIKEAYDVHKRIIEWNAQFSKNKIPDQAVGLDPLTLKLMHWAMQSWKRVQMLNKFFAGTWIPRIQLDLIPALRCAAHFVIVADKKLETIDHYIQGGNAMQHFWLTATSLGLKFQPEMTPLIFSHYVTISKHFTDDSKANKQVGILSDKLDTLLGEEAKYNRVFMGRIGVGNQLLARSIRIPLDGLRLT